MNKKITLISGPRQSGKTTLSKMLTKDNTYINYDDEDDREIIFEKSWDRTKDQVIFDEIHKMKNWKQWLKGIYDKEGVSPALTVTGSAKLNTFKKVGDSLAGRYFGYRVHPLDIRELFKINASLQIDETIERLLECSGFPEPFVENSLSFYNKWKKTHLDIILKQDLITIESVKDLHSIELLIGLLQKRVGSSISYSSLARDIQVSDKTVKRWLGILEDMYIVFKIHPYNKNIARSVLKKPKYYFYDNARVRGDMGAKIENLVANSLLKECHFRQDCLGEEYNLFYLSKSGDFEIDFAIEHDEVIKYVIEVKTSDDSLSKNISLFKKDLKETKAIQLVKNLKREKFFPNGDEVRHLGQWLCTWK